jgi:hypothetical protein
MTNLSIFLLSTIIGALWTISLVVAYNMGLVKAYRTATRMIDESLKINKPQDV